MELGLEGRVAIVTGGSRGIGGGIVECLAKEKLKIVIGDIAVEAAEKLAKGLASRNKVELMAVRTDVSKKEDAENLVATTLKKYGRVDILVNAAAVLKDVPFVDLEEDEWERVMNVNAKGVYLVTKEVVPHMISARRGRIVNISSRAGKDGTAGLSHYAMSKFAIWGLTQSLAKEVASYGITVNAVCPGIVRTDMWERILDFRATRTGLPREKIWKNMLKTIPMGKPQEPADIGNLVVFLCSEVARYITGEAIHVNGGMRMD